MTNIEFLPIHEKCQGCDRVVVRNELSFCKAYIHPSAWWRHEKSCPLASHVVRDIDIKTGKQRLGQQKQKKHR